MPFKIEQQEEEHGHVWTVATAMCHLDDQKDLLVNVIVDLVRKSYGENEILADANDLSPEIANGTFQTDHLLTAIRAGLPNPDAEGNKPPALTTYRSQSAEMVAKAALTVAYNFLYPAAPQEGAVNPNQPTLGFDGWGLLKQADEDYVLILIQVKATDENKSPPREAGTLADECRKIPHEHSALCRGLSVLARLLRGDPMQEIVLRMLERLGASILPNMHVAPAIVRGETKAQVSDLQPVRDASAGFAPTTARGIVVSVGVSLEDFGKTVMKKARQAA